MAHEQPLRLRFWSSSLGLDSTEPNMTWTVLQETLVEGRGGIAWGRAHGESHVTQHSFTEQRTRRQRSSVQCLHGSTDCHSNPRDLTSEGPNQPVV